MQSVVLGQVDVMSDCPHVLGCSDHSFINWDSYILPMMFKLCLRACYLDG